MTGSLVGLNTRLMSAMNICMISDDFLPTKTGVGTHVKQISKELAARGHNVVVITTRRRGEPKFETWNNVKVYRLFSVKVLDFYIALPLRSTIRRILLEEQIQIVHFQYLGILLKQAQSVANSLKLKKAYTYHMTVEHLIQDSKIMKLFSKRIARAIVNFCNDCDWITVPSRSLIPKLKEDRICTPIHYVSNPVGLEAKPIRDSKAPQKFVVLYVGRLHPEKNVAYLINAFALFAKERPGSELWIIGEGSLRKLLESQCQDLKIASQVRFLGQVDHSKITEYYAAASVFVLPSLVEVQPMVAIEAMHAGLPLILNDMIISARDLVAEGENGFVVDHRSNDDLAGKIRFLYDNAAFRQKMGDNAKKKSEEFAPGRIVDTIEKLYSDLVSKLK